VQLQRPVVDSTETKGYCIRGRDKRKAPISMVKREVLSTEYGPCICLSQLTASGPRSTVTIDTSDSRLRSIEMSSIVSNIAYGTIANL
jgi:hypothetical protein